jgi:hypothetical protein
LLFEFNEKSKYGFLQNKLHALTISGSFGFPVSGFSSLRSLKAAAHETACGKQ